MPPVIEQLITDIELKALPNKALREKPAFLGYSFVCWECDWYGILKNKDQLMCPKCGIPFHFENDDGGPQKIYTTPPDYDFSGLKEIIDNNPMIGEEILVNEPYEEEEDCITNAIRSA